jgi:hypothetical protein
MERGNQAHEGQKVRDYTFIDDDSLNLDKSLAENKDSGSKKDKTQRDFRLRDNTKINKLKKSKISGGHSMQGHSPVYE